jgi:hypothetical protein
VIFAAITILPARALADGAFPDEFSIFVPQDRPHEIVVPTNFGLVITDDDAMHWNWVCENDIASLPFSYFMGAPPGDMMYALNLDGAWPSPDFCKWSESTLAMDAKQVNDIFPDPNDSKHVFALAQPITTSTATDYLLESKDGGYAFPNVLFTAPPGARLESVELSKSDPHRIYMTMTNLRPQHRYVLTSTDGATHWSTIDVSDIVRQPGMPTATPHLPLIAQVDPMNADVVYFRIVRNSAEESDSLGISTDGGKTLKILYTLPQMGKMTAFLLLPDGTIILGTRGGGYISTDHGTTFKPWDNSPQIRGLAYRAGCIYAAADNFADGYAAGMTCDVGMTWKPLLRFDLIGPPYACALVQNACGPLYPGLEVMFGIDGGVSSGTSDGGIMMVTKKGCSCGAVELRDAGPPIAVAFLVGVLVVLRKKRACS